MILPVRQQSKRHVATIHPERSILYSHYTMKNKAVSFLLPVAILAAFSLVASDASAQDKAPSKDLLAKAKISRLEAEKIALAAVPDASVKSSELEEEDGALRWSFDLKRPGSKKTTEVGVDAVTGKVVENKAESEKEESKEKDDEKEERQHKAH